MTNLKPVRSLCAALLVLWGAGAHAFPDRPVRLIVSFAPGGATDVVARALAVRLGQMLGQAFIVENKPGAGGNIGADFVAKALADGHTLLMASPAEVSINQYLYAGMPFDPAKDLVPVARVATAPLVLVVNCRSHVGSIGSLVRQIGQSHKGANFASSGTGGPQHLAGEWFRILTGVKMTHVPYKGGTPAMTDLLGGQVDFFFSGLPPALAHIHTGRLCALAVTTAQRSTLLPQVPTVAEQGYPVFSIENWQGVFAPVGTPAAVVDRLAQAIRQVVENKAYSDQLHGQGASAAYLDPTEFGEFVQAERQKYRRLVRESGARAE